MHFYQHTDNSYALRAGGCSVSICMPELEKIRLWVQEPGVGLGRSLLLYMYMYKGTVGN